VMLAPGQDIFAVVEQGHLLMQHQHLPTHIMCVEPLLNMAARLIIPKQGASQHKGSRCLAGGC
jgi:hypothetical protein